MYWLALNCGSRSTTSTLFVATHNAGQLEGEVHRQRRLADAPDHRHALRGHLDRLLRGAARYQGAGVRSCTVRRGIEGEGARLPRATLEG